MKRITVLVSNDLEHDQRVGKVLSTLDGMGVKRCESPFSRERRPLFGVKLHCDVAFVHLSYSRPAILAWAQLFVLPFSLYCGHKSSRVSQRTMYAQDVWTLRLQTGSLMSLHRRQFSQTRILRDVW